MSYEFVDGDGDKITFERSDPRAHLAPGNMLVMISPQKDADDESVILVQQDEFPAFLKGIASTMGLRAAFYDPAGVAEGQTAEAAAGNLLFKISSADSSKVLVYRKTSRGSIVGRLDDADEVYKAAAGLLAIADYMREKQEAKAAEEKRQEELRHRLADVIQRGNLTRPIARSEAMRSARMVIEAGWQPPVVEAEIIDELDQ